MIFENWRSTITCRSGWLACFARPRASLLLALFVFACGIYGFAKPSLPATTTQARQQDEKRGLELYTKKIKPLLMDKCYKCHSYKHDRFENGLSVEKREDLINGGDRGAAIEPGEPEESLLIDALNYERDDLQMPPDGKLDDKDIDAIKEWIRLGAPFPKSVPELDRH